MAQQRSVTLIDDLDGGKAAETVTFGLDGANYEIDLSKKNATALRKAVADFVDHGRRVRAGSAPAAKAQRRPVPRQGPNPAAVRLWATARSCDRPPLHGPLCPCIRPGAGYLQNQQTCHPTFNTVARQRERTTETAATDKPDFRGQVIRTWAPR